MPNKYDSITQGAFDRMDADLEFETVTVTDYTTQYDPATGDTTTVELDYGSIQAEVLHPSNSSTVRELWGSDSSISVALRVHTNRVLEGPDAPDGGVNPSELSVAGDSNEAGARFETEAGKVYELQDDIHELISDFVLFPCAEVA